MHKDFDQWNTRKKALDAKRDAPRVRTREIWWCHFGVNVGHEQDGTGELFLRPVLILRVFNTHIAFVVPATSNRKDSRFYFPIRLREREGSLVLTQARLISTTRLHDRMLEERIPLETFLQIRKAFRDLF